jgi:hypothetical protein
MTNQTIQFWLAELDQYGNPSLIDGSHSERDGAEKALTLRKSLAMINTNGRRFAIAEVRLSEPTGEHGPLNQKAIDRNNKAYKRIRGRTE